VQLTTKVALAAAIALGGGAAGQAQGPGLEIRHEASPCIERRPSAPLRACVLPRSGIKAVHVVVSAAGAQVPQRLALKSDMPCYSIPSDRAFKQDGTYSYLFEVTLTSGSVVRGPAYEVVAAKDRSACSRAATAVAASPPSSDRRPRTAPTPAPARPATSARNPPSEPDAPAPLAHSPGGSSGKSRGLLIALGGGIAGGVAAVVAGHSTAASAAPTPTPTFDGRLAGTWVGNQTLVYSSGCVEADRIQLRLNESSGQVQGTLTFTVSSCLCCATVQGGDHVTGSWDGARLRLSTTGGLRYEGSVAGPGLEGAIQGMDQLSGSWNAARTP
jgi:hypothetical protein